MGYLDKLKQRNKDREEFREKVRQETKQIERDAYLEEAKIVAKERGKNKARQPYGLSSLGGFAIKTGKKVLSSPKKRQAPKNMKPLSIHDFI